MSKQVIYETKGRAREFNELSINLYSGCSHGCEYCYGASVTHQSPERFANSRPRVTPEEIGVSAYQMKKRGDTRPVLLCFLTDPYQPLEATEHLTRSAIQVLHAYQIPVTILTKAGALARRDFDLLGPNDAFATTLTCVHSEDQLKWEPLAGSTVERIRNLMAAHQKGIKTWVSLEPVIYPQDALELINVTHTFVDHFKVGTMNYHPHGKTIDWTRFAQDALKLLEHHGCQFYFKKDLAQYVGVPDGFWGEKK